MKPGIRKKYKKLFFTCTLLLAFGVISYGNSLAVEQESSDSQKSGSNKYPQNFIANYTNECMELAGEDLAQEDAQILCQCTLTEFQTRYTHEQYEQLPQETKEDVGLFCLEKLLYPDE